MTFRLRLILLALTACGATAAIGEEKTPCSGPACAALDAWFTNELWAKVAAQSCLNCHKEGGDAEETRFVLRDPKRSQGAAQEEDLRHNREAFAGPSFPWT